MMKYTRFLALSVGLAMCGALAASCSNTADDCEKTATCSPILEGGKGGSGKGTGGMAVSEQPGAGAGFAGLPESASGVAGNGAAGGGALGGGASAGEWTAAGTAGTAPAVPCGGNCPESTPVCNVETQECVACLDDSTCGNAMPACRVADHSCVACTENRHCSGVTTICDTTTNTCVACLDDSACEGTTPLCKLETRTCVGCLESKDCPTATAARCDATANSCAPCTTNADCVNISGKAVCSDGTCVQCTAQDETACGTTSCNPATAQCTSTPRGSVARCGACLADSECATNAGVSVSRCVPMTFNGIAHGNYCLESVASGCDKPYGSSSQMRVTAASLSGAPSEDYCGINQLYVTCEAIRDMQDPEDKIRCGDAQGAPDDILCGCQRTETGSCDVPGEGGLCRSINGALRCTIACSGGAECTSDRTCDTTSSPSVCN